MTHTWISCLCIAAFNVQAAETQIECPADLPADAVQIVKPPSGWTPFTPTFLPLHSVAIMTGPPTAKAMLKPSSETKRSKGSSVTWQLDGLRDVWLLCGYGEANEVTLSKQIPGAPSKCTVNYTERKPPAFTLVEIHCK
jgi:hypothetical protein